MKPYMTDYNQKSVIDIINEHDTESKPDQAYMSPGEAKRIELIRKMKTDTDKIEYMIMLNVLMGTLVVTSIWHFMTYRSWLSIISMGLGVVYFFATRVKLRGATLQLSSFKNDFDRYLWEGFHLKEMRHSAVKLAYILFFPLVCVLLMDVVAGYSMEIPFINKILAALTVSTIGWLIFFNDDKTGLEAIETDLKALSYL
jgi:hypothetical protein